MLKAYYQKNREKLQRYNGLLMTNPITERGFILAPVIVASYSTKNALALGIAFSIITFITVMLSAFIPKSIPYTLRTIFYSLIACAVFVPTAMLVEWMFPGTTYSLGVFLPLLVANSLIVIKSNSRFHQHSYGYMAVDVFMHAVGFFAVIVLVGLVREFFGNGTLFGAPIHSLTVPALLLPFAGFIVVGFFAAISQRIRNHLESPIEEKKEERK